MNTTRTIGQMGEVAYAWDNKVPPQSPVEDVSMPVNPVGLTGEDCIGHHYAGPGHDSKVKRENV